MNRAARWTALIVTALGSAGCGGDEAVTPVDGPPVINTFAVSATSAVIGVPIDFQIDATDDVGLDSAVVAYGDSSNTVLPLRGRKHVSATLTRFYADSGKFYATLSVYDTRQQAATRSLTISVTPP